VVRSFEKVSGPAVPYEIVARRPGDVTSCYADPAEAAMLEWQAQFGIERMCVNHWRWQEKNPQGFQESHAGSSPLVTSCAPRQGRSLTCSIRKRRYLAASSKACPLIQQPEPLSNRSVSGPMQHGMPKPCHGDWKVFVHVRIDFSSVYISSDESRLLVRALGAGAHNPLIYHGYARAKVTATGYNRG
jgi:hypothetical protein